VDREGKAMPSRRDRGFTLTELLVVIGIVVIVLALVLPTLGKTRESARRVECLSNVRQLSMAALAYVNVNKSYLPEAGSGNYGAFAPLSPQTQRKPPWTPLGADAYVLPSIGGLLQSYLGDRAEAYWKCPAAPADGSVEAFQFSGDDPYEGVGLNDRFWPNYSYMAGKEWFSQIHSPFAAPYHFQDWVSRNVSGLRVNQAAAGQSSSRVVIFYERQSTYHSRRRSNIYFEDGDYYATFGYLDGHAEGKSYTNATGYIGVLHRPVRQTWFGRDFAVEMPLVYENVP
jgi:prepilin-type N-terminal cleavage/methylation domain-containing protein